MRNLFLTLALVITVNANAEIVCKKDGRFWYPVNEKAKKIAKMLGVKTCNGKRFKHVVKKLNERSNVRIKHKMDTEEVIRKLQQ